MISPLTPELGQRLVEKVMGIVGRNINIMDASGRIIASGNPERVGEYHQGASIVIQRGHPVNVYPEDMVTLNLRYTGVNLPIRFGGNIIGVVGITGNPDEILINTELIRTLVELMIEQAINQEKIHLERRARDSFLQQLFAEEKNINEHELLNKAPLFGLDLTLPRIACIFQLKYHKNQEHTELSATEFQAIKEKAIYYLEEGFPPAKNEIVVAGDIHQIVLLKLIYKGWEKNLPGAIAAVIKLLEERTRLEVVAGMGTCRPGLRGLAASYREAQRAIEVGRCFYPEKKVYQFAELQLECLLADLPKEQYASYCQEIMGNISQELINTLATFFASNLNITRTAKSLFVHRNTVIFRLNKIKKITGLDPLGSFWDLFRLGAAYICWVNNKGDYRND